MFALFAVLSVLLHAVILIVLASNAGEPQRQGMQKDQQVINVAAVEIPEPPPEEPEAPEPPPPEPPRNIPPPRPEPRKPDAIRNKPIATPKPQQAQATPTPTPLPNTPSASPSAGPPPTPIPSPTPERVATEAEMKEAREQAARKILREQFSEVIDDNYQLPPDTSWEDLLKQLAPDEQAKLTQAAKDYWASKFGPINNTGRIGEGTPVDPNQPTPDPNASPEASLPPDSPSGDPNGDPNGRGNARVNLDDYIRRPDPTGTPDPSDLDGQINNIDRLDENKYNIGPTPSPYPMDYRTNALGFQLEYDGRTFQVRVPMEDAPNATILVSHYPTRTPRESSSYEVPWNPDWRNKTNDQVKAVLDEYNARKKRGEIK